MPGPTWTLRASGLDGRPAAYVHTNGAELIRDGQNWILKNNGVETALGRRATFDTAEKVMAKAARGPVVPAAKNVRLLKQQAQTARRMLQSQGQAIKLLKAPVSGATARVQATISRIATPARRDILTAVRTEGSRLAGEIQRATIDARGIARAFGRDQLAYDLDPVRRWVSKFGFDEPPPITGSAHAVELDAFEAQRTANSVQTMWGSELDKAFQQWERRQRGTIGQALDIESNFDRKLGEKATTQAVGAFADERQSYWDQLAELSSGAGGAANDDGGGAADDGEGTGQWAPQLFHIWSAVLDRRTCEDCAALDGDTRPIDEDFPEECPMHPNCRCMIVTTFDEDSIPGSGGPDPTFVADASRQVQDQTVRTLMPNF